MYRKMAFNHFLGEIGKTLTPSCGHVCNFFYFSGNPFFRVSTAYTLAVIW